MEPQQALVGGKDPGCQLGPIRLNLVPSDMLEPQPENVRLSERSH